MSKEILVHTRNVSKKYCRTLKRSLWYGVQDVAGELVGRKGSETLRLGEFWSVDNVSFKLKRGECIGLIGPNGAGKSTLLKMLNGLIKPDRGSIRMRGRVGALIELGAGFNPVLTGRENIYVNGSVLGLSKKQVDRKLESIIDFAEVEEFIDSPVKNYSSGMKIRLGFAVATNLEPDVLLIDEVLAVGDVGFRMKCFKHLLGLIDRGTSIIVVSHAVNQLSRITQKALVMDAGRVAYNGDLSTAIGCYQKLILNGKNEKQLNANSKRIESVTLCDSSGNRQETFKTGDTLCAEIKLITDEPIRGARLIAAIEHPATGLLGSFSTPWSKFAFDVIPPEVVVRLELTELPLLVGGYYINVHFYGSDIPDFFDRREPGVGFQIVGPPTNAFGFGVNHIINFKHRWSLS